MKNFIFSALALTAATITFVPSANAAETVDNIQSTRLEFLENQTKAVEDIQVTRL